MNTSILFTFSITYILALCVVYVQKAYCGVGSELKSKYQVQLKPAFFEAQLGQLVAINLPELRRKGILYLTKPNGDVIALSGDKRLPKIRHAKFKKYRDVFNANPRVFRYIGKGRIVLGPLTEDHDGNWAFTNLYNNSRGEIVEEYMLVTIRIIEKIPPVSPFELLRAGDTFKLAFSHAPAHLETCELVAPSTAPDRYYERDLEEPSTCGYKVPNVTAQDAGFWTLTAVGKVAFKAQVELKVVDKVL